MSKHPHLLAVEIAQNCKLILEDTWDLGLDPGMRTVSQEHLLWMADQIYENSDTWPATKLHRWVGFMQGVMVAYALTTIDKESSTVRKIKQAFLEEMDVELKDHQDPESYFELELGGES